jgi:hypothetical protein
MSRTKMKYVFYSLMAIALIGFAGCILSPTEEPPKDKPVVVYKDLKDKEDVPYNLVQCYNAHNIDRYMELLHEQYEWHNQDWDVQNNPGMKEFNTRDEEITTHRNFFKAAALQYTEDPTKNIDKLELVIADAPWVQITEFEGDPCADCWTTTRIYTITVEFVGGASTLVGNDLVQLTVMGVPKDGTTYYRLRRADDIKQ